jgi:hypothetical protein
MFANGSRNIPCLHKVDNISNIFSNVLVCDEKKKQIRAGVAN